jgi:hypothetical protein
MDSASPVPLREGSNWEHAAWLRDAVLGGAQGQAKLSWLGVVPCPGPGYRSIL